MFFELLTKPAHFPGLPSAAPCYPVGPALPELTPRQRRRWLARQQESPPRSRLLERQPLACPARPPSCLFNSPRWSWPWLFLSFGCGQRIWTQRSAPRMGRVGAQCQPCCAAASRRARLCWPPLATRVCFGGFFPPKALLLGFKYFFFFFF